MSSAATRLGNKLLVRSVLSQVAEARPETVEDVLARAYHPDAQWRGSHPMNEMQGVAAIAAKVWQPLLTSFPDLERRDLILIGGDYEGHDLVGAMGH